MTSYSFIKKKYIWKGNIFRTIVKFQMYGLYSLLFYIIRSGKITHFLENLIKRSGLSGGELDFSKITKVYEQDRASARVAKNCSVATWLMYNFSSSCNSHDSRFRCERSEFKPRRGPFWLYAFYNHINRRGKFSWVLKSDFFLFFQQLAYSFLTPNNLHLEY